VGSLVVIALSVLGYLAVQAWPFVVTAIAGLAVLYARGFDDLFDVNGDGDNTFMTIGAAILVFVVAVTVAGWLLPATRTVAAMVVGVAGLAALVAVFEALIVFRSVAFAFSAPEDASDFGSFRKAMHHSPYTNDVYAVLAYCAVLAALWVGCSLATGHVGFRILVVADAVAMIPLATFALMTRHPTWWEVVAAGAGGLVLMWAGLRLRRGEVSSPVSSPQVS